MSDFDHNERFARKTASPTLGFSWTTPTLKLRRGIGIAEAGSKASMVVVGAKLVHKVPERLMAGLPSDLAAAPPEFGIRGG